MTAQAVVGVAVFSVDVEPDAVDDLFVVGELVVERSGPRGGSVIRVKLREIDPVYLIVAVVGVVLIVVLLLVLF